MKKKCSKPVTDLIFLVKEARAQQTLKRERAMEITLTSSIDPGLVQAMYVWTIITT